MKKEDQQNEERTLEENRINCLLFRGSYPFKKSLRVYEGKIKWSGYLYKAPLPEDYKDRARSKKFTHVIILQPQA